MPLKEDQSRPKVSHTISTQTSYANPLIDNDSSTFPDPIPPYQAQLGFTPEGIVLEGRQPGCVLNRALSAETLSHILIEDDLKYLGIKPAAHRRSTR